MRDPEPWVRVWLQSRRLEAGDGMGVTDMGSEGLNTSGVIYT